MSEPTAELTRIELDGKQIVLVGTAHISQQSVDTVLETIRTEEPDTVCVELDQQRYQNLKNQENWKSLNLIEVIKKGQMPFLLANVALASYQKRMGLTTGVKPGAELAAAATAAEEADIQVELVDRSIRTSLLRIWRRTGFWSKMKVLATLVTSLFEKQELSEEDLAKLRQGDTLNTMLEEMGEVLPSVKTVLVDERDTYMAHKISQVPGEKIVAVVGAAHVPGILRQIKQEISPEVIQEIDTVPPKSAVSKAIPWIIPAIVAALFVGGFFFGNRDLLAEAALAWLLANGILSALGALIAWGHPITVATAFFAAPLTSLNPTIGAGMVTGLVQAFIASPTVGDMESVGDDLANMRGWWSNRLTRVMLVFVFSTMGSAMGTLIGFLWLKDLV